MKQIKKGIAVLLLLVALVINWAFMGDSNPSDKYVFVVGVADYEGTQYDLNYSDDDARLFYKRMRKLGVKKENMVLLIDENATQLNIIKKMSKLFLKADKNDEVIFFYSGHGAEGFFVPHDYNNLLSHKTVKLIFKQSRAQKKICIADACFSGSIRKKVKKIKEKSIDLSKDYTLKQKKNGGIAVMMSSTGDETSIELPQLEQGLFTYCLLEGLKGKADLNEDNTITISELFEFTKENVAYGSGGKQNPILFGNFDLNMPIIKKRK